MQGRVLVTGASGFIGSNLVETLVADSVPVRVGVRSNTPLGFLNSLSIERASVDYREPSTIGAALEGVEVVIHLAGLVAGTEEQLHSANVLVTESLVSACAARKNPPVVVLVSSLAAAGPSTPNTPKKPSDPASPVSNYGRSKWLAELAARKFAGTVPLTILRPGIVFGPRDTEVVRLLDPIRRFGLVPLVAGRDSPLSFVHVEDFIAAARVAAVRGHRCPKTTDGDLARGTGVYFVADEQSMTLSEFGNLIAPVWGWLRCRAISIPEAAARLAARGGETMGKLRGKPSTFNLDKIREAVAPAWTCDCSTTRNELHWAPTKTLPERLIAFAQSYARQLTHSNAG